MHVQGDDVFVIYGSSSKSSESLEIPNFSSEKIPESSDPTDPPISIESHETQIPSESIENPPQISESIENPPQISESLEYLKSLESFLSSESLESLDLLDLESLKSSQSFNPVPSSYKAVVRPDPIKTYRAGSEESGNYMLFKMDN